MGDVKRYDMSGECEARDMWMSADDAGEWVRYDDYAALRARLAEVEMERDKWQRRHESQLRVDFDLVNKYRRPKSGNFRFPEDVAHIIRRLDAAEAALATARRDALEQAAEMCERNAAAIRNAIGENPLIKKRMVLLKRADQSDADAAAIRALANEAATKPVDGAFSD